MPRQQGFNGFSNFLLPAQNYEATTLLAKETRQFLIPAYIISFGKKIWQFCYRDIILLKLYRANYKF
jgi:hypothetical protein